MHAVVLACRQACMGCSTARLRGVTRKWRLSTAGCKKPFIIVPHVAVVAQGLYGFSERIAHYYSRFHITLRP